MRDRGKKEGSSLKSVLLFLSVNKLTVLENDHTRNRREELGGGIARELGMAMCTLLYLKRITKSCCTTQATLLKAAWQPGREGSLGENGYTNLDRILKSRDITLMTKVRVIKAMAFPVVMYGCESWTMKKSEC